MKQIIISDIEETEYPSYAGFLSMIETAKAHGWADITIHIREHLVSEAEITLKTRFVDSEA